MAGFCIVIMLPIILAIAAVAYIVGIVALLADIFLPYVLIFIAVSSIFWFGIALAADLILKHFGIFLKYSNSTVTWQRVVSKISHIILIIVIILSAVIFLGSLIGAIILFNM